MDEMSREQRVVVIDLGSNSFHLVQAVTQDGQFTITGREREQVQLAKFLDENNHLSPEGIAQGLAVMKRFAQLIERYKPKVIKVLATNTIRVAENRDEFVLAAEAIIGTPIDVISGEEEARLIFQGASMAEAESILVIDIGGGSTEIATGACGTPKVAKSLPMGCVAYSPYVIEADDIEVGMDKCEALATAQLNEVQASYAAETWQAVCGCSGTVTAVCEVLSAKDPQHNGLVTLAELLDIKAQLKDSESGPNIRGLRPGRGLVFPSGLAILIAIFKVLNLQSMRLSKGGLREGMLFELAKSEQFA